LKIIAHNVLVVYDGLATQISETVGFAGLPNCGGDKTAQRRLRRLWFFVARAALWRRSIYNPVKCRFLIYIL